MKEKESATFIFLRNSKFLIIFFINKRKIIIVDKLIKELNIKKDLENEMNEIKFKLSEKDKYSIVSFEVNNAIIPEVLVSLNPPKVNPTKGVVLSGRAPIWFYCYLTHYYHPTRFIATYDPRIGGAIIVESHVQDYKPGDIIKIDINEL